MAKIKIYKNPFDKIEDEVEIVTSHFILHGSIYVTLDNGHFDDYVWKLKDEISKLKYQIQSHKRGKLHIIDNLRKK